MLLLKISFMWIFLFFSLFSHIFMFFWSNLSNPLVFRSVFPAMKAGSGGARYLVEVYSDFITVRSKGAVSDVWLTGSVQRD